ncbi:O-antigen translocase [Vibrio splendidus]|uniref:O-antigen translocase n=1 Tax=Vibrio splendidus TaxID=29497 RepID=A0A2T5E6T8_VIBSP|nr:O-antigen translocase [Vibrio splendidus]OEE51103.1 hypothetical protein A147_07130 [Vibrio splendidus FF-6]PTP15036.1 O-antigen translocase [Vibrio splendidus]
MSELASKKQILRSSSIIGGASIITIFIGLIKVKLLAIMLGPAGIGLMGVLLTLLAVSTSIFGMGLNISGVREVALTREDMYKSQVVRKAIVYLNIILAIFALLTIYTFRVRLSEWIFNNEDNQWHLILVGFAIFMALISNSQLIVLQGFREIEAQAKIKIWGAIIATIFGLTFVYFFDESGVTGFVATVPIVTCILGFYYSRGLPTLGSYKITIKELSLVWKTILGLGAIYMLSSAMGEGTKLLVRNILDSKFGIESVGYFQASWSISMTYIGFILSAMAADYYPRLASMSNNRLKTNELVNQQTEIALIFSAPILLVMLSYAPLAIRLLYTEQFFPSIEILRWQVLGDILKVMSWPLGFIILAKGNSIVFFGMELIWNFSYVIFVYLGVDYFGVEATGYAFLISYLLYYMSVYVFVTNKFKFKLTKKNKNSGIIIVITSLSILTASYINEISSYFLGGGCIMFSFYYCVKFLKDVGSDNKLIMSVGNLINKFR